MLGGSKKLENQDFREIIEEYDNSIVVGAGITGVW